MFYALTKPLARNCSMLTSSHGCQSIRRIRLLRKKPPPLQKHVADTKCMFGQLRVPNKKRSKMNSDLKTQRNTEFSCMRKVTGYPCRRLIRKEHLQPEVPPRWIKFPYAIYNTPKIVLRSRQNVKLNKAKAIKEMEDNNFQLKDSVSKTISLSTVIKTQLPTESQVTQIKHNPIIFNEEIIKKGYPKTLDDRICKTVTGDEVSLHLPSITMIMNTTETKLQRHAYARILEGLDPIEKEKHTLIVKEFQQHGIDMESYLKQLLCAKGSQILEASTLILKSLRYQFKKVKDIKALQTQVVHPTLLYKGCVDCVALYKDSLSVIEWLRTDKKIKTGSTLYDVPVQLAAYIGAINASRNYPFQIRKGVIIIASTNGETAAVCELNEHKLRMYWYTWLHRLQRFYVMVKR